MARQGGGGDSWRFLRRSGKHYDRRGAQHAGRAMISYRINIAECPAIVAVKARLGEWEGHPIVRAQRKGPLLTYVEHKACSRLSRNCFIQQPSLTPRVTAHRLNSLRDHVCTITYDKGKEFAGHRDTADLLCAQVYCATPYHAWECDVSESINGLIREFFPQGTDFTAIHPATVVSGERLLNRRPRKPCGFQMPNEVFRALVRRS